MRSLLILITLVFSSSAWSQETYTSPFTQDVDTGIIEDISRSITIRGEEITIITETSEGKDIQSLMIKGKETTKAGNTVYFCTSKGGHHKTIAILAENDDAPYLDILQPSVSNPEHIQHLRIMLD